MTSVINSARRSTASAFDLIGNSALALNQLLATGVKAIDALDSKTSVMHASITEDAKHQMKIVAQRSLANAMTELMEVTESMNELRTKNQSLFDECHKLLTSD